MGEERLTASWKDLAFVGGLRASNKDRALRGKTLCLRKDLQYRRKALCFEERLGSPRGKAWIAWRKDLGFAGGLNT